MSALMKIEPAKLKSRRLTNADKKTLVNVIISEFDNQSIKYQADIASAREEFLDKYKKKMDFKEKVENYNKAAKELERRREELNLTGLDIEGNIVNGYYGQKPEIRKVVEHIEKGIREYTENMKDATSLKNKAITAVTFCETYDEGQKLMNQLFKGE
jgi:hypothetical protein